MSYGITIYPKIEDFPNTVALSTTQLQNASEGSTKLEASIFVEIRALAFCTPYNLFGKDAYFRIDQEVNQYIDDYIKSYEFGFEASHVLDLKEQSAKINEGDVYNDGTPKRPFLFFNRFTYDTIWQAKETLKDLEKSLNLLKGRIKGLCYATPIDITPRDQEQYSDGHEEPLYYLERELDSLEDSVNDCLYNICATKLIIKYWDGHKKD